MMGRADKEFLAVRAVIAKYASTANTFGIQEV
jgi:hypothetical protein